MCMNFRLLSVLAAIISSTLCQSSFYNGADPQFQQESKFKCIEEGYHPDPKDCRVYYRCVDWGNTSPLTTFQFECGVGTVFSKNKGNICVHPNESERPECGDLQNEIDPDWQESQQPSSTTSGISVSSGYRSATSTSLSPTSNQLDVNKKHATGNNQCDQEGFMEDAKDCQKFYRCVKEGSDKYVKYEFTCGTGTVWDQKIQGCNHPWAVSRKECQNSNEISSIQGQGNGDSSTVESYPGEPGQPIHPNQPNEPAYPSQPDKPTHPNQPDQPSYPNQPNKPAYPSQPDGPSYPNQPGQPSYPNQPNEPAYPSQPDESTHPNQPGQPSYPNQPNKPTHPNQSNQPTYPDQPDQPSYPNQPNEPAYPNQPNEPNYPDQPEQPSYPSKPDGPTHPSHSGQPIYPNQPNEPDYPSQPDDSTYPNQPGQPSFPNQPDEPAYPSRPDNPTYPSQSGQPSYPNQPNKPAFPSQPDNPTYPSQSGKPGHPNKTTKPTYPEKSTQPSYPIQPNEPAYPGQPDNPNYPGPSGQPSYPNQTNKPPYPGQPDDPKDLSSTAPPNSPSSSLLPPTSGVYEPSSSYSPITTTPDATKGPGSGPSQQGSTPGMLGTSGTESNSIRPEQNEGANVPGDCSQEGFFPDPQDCRKFYRCVADGSKYTKYEFKCGTGTGWDSKLQTCNHLHALPNCTNGTDASGNNEETDPSLNEINSTKQPNDQKPTKIPLQPAASAMPPDGSSTISGADDIMSTSSQATTGITSITSSLPPKVSSTYIPSDTAGSPTPSTEISTTTSSTLGSTPIIPESTSLTSPQGSPQTPVSETFTSTTEGTGQITSTTRSSSSPSSPTESTISESTDCQEDGFFPNKKDCKKFYRCVKDASGHRKFNFDCGPGTAWDQGLQTCNYISQVASCQATNQDQQGISPSSQSPISGAPPTMTSSTPDKNNDKPDTAIQQPDISSTPSITDDKPASGKPEAITVPTDSSSESSSSSTSMSESSSSSSSSESSSSSSSTSESSSSTSESSSSTSDSSSPTSNSSESSDSSSSKPSSEKPDCSTPKPNSTVVCNTPGFYAHPTRCDKFYRCVDNGNGFNVYHFDCAPGTIFDPSISVCNYPESVYPARDCSSEQQPSTGNSDSPSSTSASTPAISGSPPTSTESMTESGTTLHPIESTTSEGTSGPQESTPASETTGPSMETTSSETSTTEPSSGSPTSESSNESTEMSTDTSSDATSQTEDGSMTTEATSMTTEASSMTTESTLTTESAEQASTDSGMTDQSQATTEMSSETTTSQESTTATGGTQETTEKPPDSTEQSTTGSQDSTTESQEMTSDSTTPQEPGFANCPIAANLTDEQVLLVCPTGFRRHPKFCNILYQCTSEGNMEIKIVTLSCPENTIFDDMKVQCVPEAESSQPCMTSTASARFYRQLEGNSLAPVKISTQSLCPSEGHYPFREGCSNAFYKCKNNSRGSLQGYLYKCPKDFVYWSVSRRCERATRLPMCTRLGNTTESNSWETRWEVPIEDHNLSARMLHFN